MKIDLHVHSACSDGAFSVEEIFDEAKRRKIDFISITDHDSVGAQARAVALAAGSGINYVTGVELNITFHYPPQADKSFSLDFLGYGYDFKNKELRSKLELMRKHRENRARQIMRNLNNEFDKENIERLTEADIRSLEESVDGSFGRPHIADYLVEKGIVRNRQEAFDKYLVKCDVPKYPLSLAEASGLIRNAGGVLVHAHPDDPHGTSLVSITPELDRQTDIIEEYMLNYIDGLECWHSRHDARTTAHYIDFARKHGLLMTGGSDCHQKPVVMGTLDIPDFVAGQFKR